MSVDWFELAYTVLGGLCVFLFGMRAMSESLQACGHPSVFTPRFY